MATKVEILQIYSQNHSYAETARLLGISRQRVHQSIARNTLEYRARAAAYNRRKYGQKRSEVISFLGSKCIICGFSDPRALQIDHVNGGGVREAKKIKDIYIYLKKVMTDENGKYQLLCANCNWIKRAENNENPYHYSPNNTL